MNKQEVQEVEAFLKQANEFWAKLGKVPDCPACKGTGKPSGKWGIWATQVFWKGELFWVCHNCEGRGKA